MDDKSQVLIKANDNILLGGKPILLNDPVVQKQLEQITQQSYTQTLYQPPKMDYVIKNPHEKTEQLLEENNQELHSIHYEDMKTNAHLQTLLKVVNSQNDELERLKSVNKELKEVNDTLKSSNKHSFRDGVIIGLIPLALEWIIKIVTCLLRYLELIPE